VKQFLLFLKMLALPGLLFSQNIEIQGIVKDAGSGEPLPGATILEKSTGNGTITGVSGQFSLRVNELPVTLAISYLGYETIEQEIFQNEKIDIALHPIAGQLSEIVVTALGIERQTKALGYAVQELDGTELSYVRPDNLVNGLSGRLAGVQINNGASGVGSSSRIIIRGESSLTGRNEALFVVDGVPISNETVNNDTENTSAGFQEVDYGNGAAELSPDDIESVTILRGAGATALYGARGANGVVVIKTKTGKGQQGIGVSVNSCVTFETPLTMPQYQNRYGQGENGRFGYENGDGAGEFDGGIRSYGPVMSGQLIPQFDSPSTDVNGNIVRAGDVIARNGNAITPTPFSPNPNNVRDFFETGRTFINNVALSGSSDRGYFRLSYTNFDNQGIVPNTDLKRNSVALSGGYQLTDRLKFRSFFNYINSESTNRPATGYGSENMLYLFTWMGRQVDVNSLKDYWQAGQEGVQQFNYNYTWMDNPYFALYENTNGFNKNRLLGNLSVTYDFTENLSLSVRSGMDSYDDVRSSRRAFSSQRFRNGAYREDLVDFREINTDFLLKYERQVNEQWSFSLSGGGNRMDQHSNYKMLMATELSVPGVYNFENSRVPLQVRQFNQKKRVSSLYALGQVGFHNGLFLDLSLRNDWSSTLPPSDNSFAYWSASLSGVLTEFFKMPELIGFAKVRLSYAVVGNDTDPFNYTNSFVFGNPYGSNPTVSNDNLLKNSSFRPESTNSFEVGTDIRLLRNRIGIDLTFYNNNSRDQIVELPVSSSSGFSSRIVNGGNIRNRGVELVLNLSPMVRDKFAWNTFVVFTKNKNTVERLPEGIQQYVTGFARVYDRSDRAVYFIAEEGGSIGNMFGTGFKTVNGRHVYDQNGNPVKDPNLRLLGNYNPDFILGLGSDFRYGPFNFGFLFDYRHGGTIVSRLYAIATTSGVLENSAFGRETGIVGEGIVNVGTTENPQWVENTKAIPAASYYDQFFDRDNEANALWDATYLKLREVRIGYTLPASVLKRAGMADLRISLIGRNLALWTDNPHFDPELNAMQGRSFAQGVEDMSYPSSRSWGVSLGVKF
jgi:TonB-linked SusC/RagA family outer membrane protein